MAGRGKFKIPSENELGKNKPDDVKSMSLFSNYKLKKASDTAAEQDKLEKATGSTASASSSTSNVNKPFSAPPPVKPSLSSLTVVKETSSTVSSVKSTSNSTDSTMTSDPVPAPAPASVAAGSKSGTGNSIVVNFRQRGNPILKHIRNVPWEYSSIVPDYVMGKANCALFLSLRYHQLHPAYLHNRLKELGKGYDLRVLLAQVDVTDPHHLLKDLAKICILADLTLILAFTPEEGGRYLESFKVYENKPAEALMERTDTDFMSKVNDCLTTVKAVNKTDCMTLMSSFKSMEGIINSSKEDLSICAGFGPHKAQRLYNVLHESFVKGRKRRSDSSYKGEQATDVSPTKKPR